MGAQPRRHPVLRTRRTPTGAQEARRDHHRRPAGTARTRSNGRSVSEPGSATNAPAPRLSYRSASEAAIRGRHALGQDVGTGPACRVAWAGTGRAPGWSARRRSPGRRFCLARRGPCSRDSRGRLPESVVAADGGRPVQLRVPVAVLGDAPRPQARRVGREVEHAAVDDRRRRVHDGPRRGHWRGDVSFPMASDDGSHAGCGGARACRLLLGIQGGDPRRVLDLGCSALLLHECLAWGRPCARAARRNSTSGGGS